MNPMTIKIKVGELGAQFLQRNNLPAKGHIDKQPAGLNFYEHDWSTKVPGVVKVEHGTHSFEIPFALGVVGTEDADKISDGIADFSIRAGISPADTIMHDEARKEFVTVLQNLIRSGWKPFIAYEDPRLSGEQAYRYYEEDNYYAVPINYSPTLEQWMRISTARWYLYADGVFLEINFQRDSSKMNPNQPGAYLFSFNLQSKEEKAKAQFEGDDRDHWQDLWVDKIKSLKKQRYEKEQQLVKRGYTIFTDYEEPKIHSADPVEP
ncbi:MAG: hypothetical protein EOO52_11395 [Gammaproteobacteria bacterium]|nr:MAG: hypothetical protein EOO52_11395 [Gammaproteobacteria bacterium]